MLDRIYRLQFFVSLFWHRNANVLLAFGNFSITLWRKEMVGGDLGLSSIVFRQLALLLSSG
jgi:hypothetical protein